MAEIKIEKKKPVWPWILLLLGIIALIYFLFFRDREAEQDVIEEVEETTGMVTPQTGVTGTYTHYLT
ncbi:hypothetical protein CHU92_08600 [Flavobacterium cyanobacteriorum]|uniref:Uncharacterized protein n=1 Tax=Flavobacterium cyanobacteriorum TaxID=2022802 RepID=A0A255Z746_9FLAO|nr:hypothetical protein [Flavobacterium cyanobacteriorum]OYQ37241.1 hypothetical protein CHU92_08600 [Flavobacterium cyanobacteriorum]